MAQSCWIYWRDLSNNSSISWWPTERRGTFDSTATTVTVCWLYIQYEPTVAVGALYTLYGLWYCQSMRKRSESDLKPRRIRISLQCWGGLNQFVQVMAKEDHTDFVAVYQRMITERVFTFSMYPTAYLLGNKWENTTEYDECSGIIYDEELHSLVNWFILWR